MKPIRGFKEGKKNYDGTFDGGITPYIVVYKRRFELGEKEMNGTSE